MPVTLWQIPTVAVKNQHKEESKMSPSQNYHEQSQNAV